jgi:hypothetical protein
MPAFCTNSLKDCRTLANKLEPAARDRDFAVVIAVFRLLAM